MGKLTRLSSLSLVVVILGACGLIEGAIKGSAVERQTKNRVNIILTGIKEEGGGSGTKLQTAISMWWADKMLISDLRELGDAQDAFERWQREANIYPKISSFEVEEAEIVEDADVATAIVSGTINGKAFKMKVPSRGRVSWVQKPTR